MADVGDALLFTLSARKEMPWSGFRDAFDNLYRPRPDANIEPARYGRWRAARLLDSLGHAEVAGAGERVCIAPPVLASLPTPGLPIAVLCGSRAPATVKTVRSWCAKYGHRATVERQTRRDELAPSRIEVEASSIAALACLAGEAGLHLARTPPAWVLAEILCSVDDYLASLEWTSDPEVNWPRDDFIPGRLRFAQATGALPGDRLSSYKDPSRHIRVDRLWIGGKSARADKSWARYAVLRAAGMRVLGYERASGAVAVPKGVPLPRLAARAFTLCSGYAPESRRAAIQDGRRNREYDIYAGVPEDVFDAIASKLGQA